MSYKDRFRNKKNKLYYQFLEHCLEKYKNLSLRDVSGLNYQKHHIVPKFIIKDFCSCSNASFKEQALYFQDSSENIILLSEQDHIEAHRILFDIYGDIRDQGAVLLLKGSLSDAKTIWRKAGALATHASLRKRSKNFWDSSFQKEQGRKSLLKSNALETRSEAGKIGGRRRQMDRIIKSKDRYVFSYKSVPYLCIFHCSTGGDVIRQLNSAIKTPISRISPLLNKSRQRAYNWSCILIR